MNPQIGQRLDKLEKILLRQPYPFWVDVDNGYGSSGKEERIIWGYKSGWLQRRGARKKVREIASRCSGEEQEAALRLIEREEADRKEYIKERRKEMKGCGCMVAVLAGVLAVGGLAVKSCLDEDARRQESYAKYAAEQRDKYVPPSILLEMTIRSRNVDLGILEDRKDLKNRKLFEDSIRKADEKIQQDTREIRMKLEKGYLKPGDMYYDDYQKIFGNEPWWPKENSEGKEKF